MKPTSGALRRKACGSAVSVDGNRAPFATDDGTAPVPTRDSSAAYANFDFMPFDEIR